jgi:hypothetical protein
MFTNKRNKILYWIGVALFFIGTLDPMEGSVVIAAGSLLISASCFLEKVKYWKLFLGAFVSILSGVFFLFFLSSLGGFGGNSKLSWHWGLAILPYPIGWLMTIVLIMLRKRPKQIN